LARRQLEQQRSLLGVPVGGDEPSGALQADGPAGKRLRLRRARGLFREGGGAREPPQDHPGDDALHAGILVTQST
jgi:hypothetical protein